MNDLLEEALEEAVGASSKRWALILIAFVIGGVLALWLAQRIKGAPLLEDGSQHREPPVAQTQPG